jgi:hypothetical protein
LGIKVGSSEVSNSNVSDEIDLEMQPNEQIEANAHIQCTKEFIPTKRDHVALNLEDFVNVYMVPL